MTHVKRKEVVYCGGLRGGVPSDKRQEPTSLIIKMRLLLAVQKIYTSLGVKL